jgi:hypothetical protein
MLADPEIDEFLHRIVHRGLKDGYWHRLLPRHQVYLFAPEGDEVGSRFAALFVSTWKRMPLWARRSILRQWRTTPFEKHLLTMAPAIELLSAWSNREPRRGLRGEMGCCARGGCMLRFWSKVVEVMPDDLVCDLIAHELAHVFQWASGVNVLEEDSYLIEEDADILVKHWGFSADGIDEWARAKGITKVIDLDKLSPRQRRRYWARSQRAGR